MIKSTNELTAAETLKAWDRLIVGLQDKLSYCEDDISIQLVSYSSGVALWDVYFTDDFCSKWQMEDLMGDRDDLNGITIHEGQLRARFLTSFD